LTLAAFARREHGCMNVAHPLLDPDAPVPLAKGLCALAVMTKAPVPGKVKTRLTPPLTPGEAAALNVCFLRDTAESIQRATASGVARGIAVYTPLGFEAAYEGILPADFALLPQRGNGFGERLSFANHDLLHLGFASVCLIDSDSPTVPSSAFSEAARILAGQDCVVLGPSADGGYYLIGLKNPHHSLFEDIDWSTGLVLEQTIERARQIDLKVHLLPTWYDVDDRATLQRLCRELFGGERTGGYSAPATRGYLEGLLRNEGRTRIWPDEALA
jgi:rSAM/selenodomain-associated transferase 1